MGYQIDLMNRKIKRHLIQMNRGALHREHIVFADFQKNESECIVNAIPKQLVDSLNEVEWNGMDWIGVCMDGCKVITN